MSQEQITFVNPAIIRLPHINDEVKRFLTYRDKTVEYQIHRLKTQYRYGGDWVQEKIDDLKSKINAYAVWETPEGEVYSYSGLKDLISTRFGWKIDYSNLKLPETKLLPWNKPPKFDMWQHQKDAFEKCIQHSHCAVELPTGCHAPGERILMYDGSFKSVETIKIGDVVMGPNSVPQNVIRLYNGHEEMFKIKAITGEEFTVNGNHILSLKQTSLKKNKKYQCHINPYGSIGGIVNISVFEYIKKSKYYKHIHKLYRPEVIHFNNNSTLDIDPYILGIWLGDGHSGGTELTSMDSEIIREWKDYGESLGLLMFSYSYSKRQSRSKDYRLSSGTRKGARDRNKFLNKLKDLNLIKNKHIPQQYLTANVNSRLQLLAGIIDTDGYLGRNVFEITQKNQRLAKDISFLARSLGLRVHEKICTKKCQTGAAGEYLKLSISGNTEIVPTKLIRKIATTRKQIKNHLVSKFTVESVGRGEFFGFQLDGNNLYMIENFIVNHNSGKTAILTNIIKHFGLKTVVMVPSASIANQLHDEFIERFGIKYVGMYGDGKKNYKKMITVCVAQALAKLSPDDEAANILNKADVLCVDESHLIAAETFEAVCMNILKDVPYRYFFSATQIRNDGSGIVLNGITGPVVHRKSFEDLVSEKILAKPVWKMFNVTSDSPSSSSDPKKETRKHLYYNQNVIDMAANIANKSVTACNRQTVILIEEFEQFAKLYAKIKVPFVFASGGVQITNNPESKNTRGYELSKILAGIPESIYNMDPKEAIAQFNEGKVPLIIGTSAISTGIDLKPTRCLIYLQGGTSPIKVKQGVGRGTRMVPGKEDCWFIDFNVKNSPVCSRHAMKRKEIYEELYGKVEFIG